MPVSHKCRSAKKVCKYRKAGRSVKRSKKTHKNVRKMQGGGSEENIILNENELIDSLFNNKEIPFPIIPNNICENKEGFFNINDNNQLGEQLSEDTNITNIPKELYYCLGNKNPNNNDFYRTYKDILPGQDSVSKEIVRYKKNELLKEYKLNGFIKINFGNCCKNLSNNNMSKSKFTPYLPDEHHRFIAAIELKLPIKLIKKNNLIQSIGPVARKDWSNFTQANINTPWVKKAIEKKCNSLPNNNKKTECKKTGNLLYNNQIFSIMFV